MNEACSKLAVAGSDFVYKNERKHVFPDNLIPIYIVLIIKILSFRGDLSYKLPTTKTWFAGIRAVIAVLRAAGNVNRRFPSEDEFVFF